MCCELCIKRLLSRDSDDALNSVGKEGGLLVIVAKNCCLVTGVRTPAKKRKNSNFRIKK